VASSKLAVAWTLHPTGSWQLTRAALYHAPRQHRTLLRKVLTDRSVAMGMLLGWLTGIAGAWIPHRMGDVLVS
jgi:hypothetical protein